MSIPVITKVIRAGSECPEQGDLKALEHEVVCNNLGAKVENAHDVENTSPVYSEAGTIYCNPLPLCRTLSATIRSDTDSCPEDTSVEYNAVVALTWSAPASDTSGPTPLTDSIDQLQIWRLHSSGPFDDGEGVTAADWNTYGRGNWQLVHTTGSTATTFQDSTSVQVAPGTAGTGSWATYPMGRTTYFVGKIPTKHHLTGSSGTGAEDDEGHSLASITDGVAPGTFWSLAKNCEAGGEYGCQSHKYKYMVIATTKCGSLLWTTNPALLNYYTGSNAIAEDKQLQSTRMTEWQFEHLASTDGCGAAEVAIPCCNLYPCTFDQSFYVDCNLTTTGTTDPTTNYITFALDGRQVGGAEAQCFHTTSNPTLDPSNGSDLGQLYFSCPDATTAEPCADGVYYPTGGSPRPSDTGYGSDGTDPHPCHGSGSNSSALGIMTYIPPINWSGSVTIPWKIKTECGFESTSTVTINVHCPTCIDEEKRYNICDATIEQLSAEHIKGVPHADAGGTKAIEQVPFSLYRKGPGSLRNASYEYATMILRFTGFPNANSRVTFKDARGISITLKFKGGVTTSDASVIDGDGYYEVGLSGLSGGATGYEQLADRVVSTMNAQTKVAITADDHSSAGDGYFKLTQDHAGPNGMTPVATHGTTNITYIKLFDNGGYTVSGSAYVVTKGYDGLTLTGSNS